MAKRSKTKAEKQHLDLVSSLGCVVCRNMGFGPSPAEIHHIRAGQGMGQRAAHTAVLPLCPMHHRACYPTGFHAAPRHWQAQYGTEKELLEQTRSDLQNLVQLIV